MNDVEDIIPLVLSGDIDAINLYAPVLETLSNLLRAHLIAAQGHVLLAGDYAAIEARVLAWLAGQEDLLEMFRQGQDPYKAMAAKVYKVAASEVDKRQRQMGKVAVLGLGYQMGKKTFRTTCANWGMFVEEPFAADVVKVYRDANPEIVRLWEVLDAGARKAVRNPGTYFKGPKIDFVCRDGWLEMILPSGRSLYYAEPKLVRVPTPWDEKELREVIECWFYSSYTHQWTQRKMYGGLWVENAVQAISRDILAESMLALEADGYPIVLTVHDEIVAEIPADYIKGRLARFVELMKRAPAWAEGCPIEVEAWAGKRYKK